MKPVRKIAIGLLYFNKNLPQFERSLWAAMLEARAAGVVDQIDIIERQGLAVDMARNSIVADAIKRNYDAVVWIDTDLVFPADALVHFVGMASAGHPVACGLYRLAKPPFHLLVKGDGPDWLELDDLRGMVDGGVVPVRLSAGGFSIVNMDVYKAMPVPWYCNWDFLYSHGPVGEDTFFMQRLAKSSVPVVVDPELHAVHWSMFGPVPVVDDQPEMEFCR